MAEFHRRNAEIKANHDAAMKRIREKDEARMAEIKASMPARPVGSARPSWAARQAYRYKVAASVENISHGLGGLAFTAWDGLPDCVEVFGTTYWKP